MFGKNILEFRCWIARRLGGKHVFENGKCVRCGRKQPVRKPKPANAVAVD